MALKATTSFTTSLKEWREYRKFSQLDLALEADVSQKHVSYLETGRSNPTPEMIVRLAEALDIPLRERNLLLLSAGYRAGYQETDLTDPSMTFVNEALTRMLKHHDPFPALVVDRYWTIKKTNSAADALIALLPDVQALAPSADSMNLAFMTVHPQGLRQYITNWEQAFPLFIQRLKREAAATGDPKLMTAIAELLTLSGSAETLSFINEDLMPVIPLEMDINGLKLSLFTVIATFGTAQDITTDELRIESFYPANAETEAFFTNLSLKGI
ncbi:helix-turn-helix transcriptional regulator [Temperatibacter marinus]|uniref:Helix-turn-helix transcriptional regulator n=1 Tax=Temperatibacter marinus TaxID=1456591 RepID=A0AA52EBN3_9PROT|nr:helix-turn-helix transcriptional regulator [Temperatibacter marinus]WND01755.1 helix-turn-helix transcriptional regulator [Temperatibacter marinus]